MSEPCCYQDSTTGRLRKSCHGGFESCGAEPRCCFCGQTGHLAKDCPAERWPRVWRGVRDWFVIAVLCLAIVGTVVWMGMIR